MSARGSTSSLRTCSGAIVAGVPMITPAAVSLLEGSFESPTM